MKKKQLAVYTVLVLLLTSCVSNGFVKFYNPYVDPTRLPDVELLGNNAEPRIFQSNNLQDDVALVESDHYLLVGYSSFVGPLNRMNDVKEECKKNGATVVLVFSKFDSTRNVSGAIAIPQVTTSNVYGTVTTDQGFGSYSGTSTTTGTTEVPYSYNVDRYHQEALYFVKTTKHMRLGVLYNNLSPAVQDKVQRNTGVVVTVVYKGTPAYVANVLRGDVIIKMNGVDMENAGQFNDAIGKFNKGDAVTLTLIRNGETREISFASD